MSKRTVADLARENWLPGQGQNKLFKQSLDFSEDLGHLEASSSFATMLFQDEHSSCNFNSRLDAYRRY